MTTTQLATQPASLPPQAIDESKRFNDSENHAAAKILSFLEKETLQISSDDFFKINEKLGSLLGQKWKPMQSDVANLLFIEELAKKGIMTEQLDYGYTFAQNYVSQVVNEGNPIPEIPYTIFIGWCEKKRVERVERTEKVIPTGNSKSHDGFVNAFEGLKERNTFENRQLRGREKRAEVEKANQARNDRMVIVLLPEGYNVPKKWIEKLMQCVIDGDIDRARKALDAIQEKLLSSTH